MAARDMLSLDTSVAPKLLRCLYTIALVLILVGTALGVVRGVRVMLALPPPPAVATAPGAAAPVVGPAMGQMRPPMMRPMMGPGGPMMMRRRFERFRGMRGPGFMRSMPRPIVGASLILFVLLRGLIALLVVRVLAEMGLAVLSLKRD